MPQIWRTQRPHVLIKADWAPDGHRCPEADSMRRLGRRTFQLPPEEVAAKSGLEAQRISRCQWQRGVREQGLIIRRSSVKLGRGLRQWVDLGLQASGT